MKRITGIVCMILVLTLCLSLAACGKKTEVKGSSEPAGYTVGTSYHWKDIDFELAAVTDDLSEYDEIKSTYFESKKEDAGDPEGKLVAVKFNVTKGQMSSSDFAAKLYDGAITLSDGSYYKFIAVYSGKSAEQVGIETAGVTFAEVSVFFDVSKDYYLNKAELTVKED